MGTTTAKQQPNAVGVSLRSASKVFAAFALAHLSLLVLIHLQNYFCYVEPARTSAGVSSSLTTFLLSFHVDNVLLSATVGLVAAIGATVSRTFKWSSFVLVSAVQLHVLLNQSFFKMFFGNFDFSYYEGHAGMQNLLDSFAAEIDGVFYANCAVITAIAVTLFRMLAKHPRRTVSIAALAKAIVSEHRRGLAITVAGMGALTVAVCLLNDLPAEARHHPLTSLITYTSPPPPDASTVPKPNERPTTTMRRIQRPTWGDQTDDSNTGQLLSSLADDIESRPRRPNIVLIVLESVGALQLLSDTSLPSRTVTPNLHDLCDHAIVFDTVYTIAPGTTAAHVTLSTGGLTSTQGSAYMELQYHYDAPTLVGSLEALGYDTALFSSQALDFGNLSGFYQKLGYDHFYDFKDASPEYKQARELHSWGAEEQATFALALEWLDSRTGDPAPFFLHYVANATHHPYSVAEGYPVPLSGNDRKTRYLNALHYTDYAIAEFLSGLEQRGLLDNTLVAITGDHGEAFAERHAENLGHRNRLYEENIKSFLIVASSALIPATITSDRVGTLGDIMPTLLDLVGGPTVDVPGQSLVATTFESRSIFSHKDSAPPLWAIRDGSWKFIGERIGRRVELYNLDSDPLERVDIASNYPEMTARYNELAARWHVAINEGFTSRLRGYKPLGGRFLEPDEVRTSGPKNVAFGKYLNSPDGRRFQQQSTFGPNQEIVVWTQYIQFRESTNVIYRWRSPSGQEHEHEDTVRAGTTHTRIITVLQRPLEAGLWRLTLLVDGEEQAVGRFTVEPLAESEAEDERLSRDAGADQQPM